MTQQQVRDIAAALNDRLEPDIYAVLTLKQGIRTDDGCYIKGDPLRYAGAYDQFIRRLSKQVYGPTIYRRHRKLVPNVGTLEGGDGLRWHFNVCLRRPDRLSIDDYKAIFMNVWLATPWAMPDSYFEQSTGDAVGYSLKDGPDALLMNSLSF